MRSQYNSILISMITSYSYGIIILAAGNSSRLGEPKQLLKYQNKSLIQHVAESAIEAVGESVVVVTGSNYNLVTDELNGMLVHFAYNNDWQEGMASSIRTGVHKLLSINSSISGIIIAVSDQPFITSNLFLNLIAIADTSNNHIVASHYDDSIGTPALFKTKYFDFLLNLKGAEGARKLLKRFEDDITIISFPMGGIDIDTQEDYRNLLNR